VPGTEDDPTQDINQEVAVSMVPSANGFLLLDAETNLVVANHTALQILCYPNGADRIKQPAVFLAERVRSVLLANQHGKGRAFVKEFKSGNRRYMCKTFQLDCDAHGSVQPAFAVVLERNSASIEEASGEFDLTDRERETVELVLQGFTSKEIANRMNISPNTVKAFLRLVMVKMKVSTRSGIAGKISRLTSER
jgi:DNA-binding CsgD family transcriptional regulator